MDFTGSNVGNTELSTLTVIEKPQVKLEDLDWHKQSLRKCLHALGLSDEEIRYRKGARAIVLGWTGEVDNLQKLVHDKWKVQVVKCHEANNGGDPEQWKRLNSIYSTILKKLAPSLPKVL